MVEFNPADLGLSSPIQRRQNSGPAKESPQTSPRSNLQKPPSANASSPKVENQLSKLSSFLENVDWKSETSDATENGNEKDYWEDPA